MDKCLITTPIAWVDLFWPKNLGENTPQYFIKSHRTLQKCVKYLQKKEIELQQVVNP
jgi:hypothetical protein